jgi:hypothetical protein
MAQLVNDDLLSVYLVDHAVGITRNKGMPEIGFPFFTPRIYSQVCEAIVQGVQEALSKAGGNTFMMHENVRHFLDGLRHHLDLETHRPAALRASLMASSTLTGTLSPLR